MLPAGSLLVMRCSLEGPLAINLASLSFRGHDAVLVPEAVRVFQLLLNLNGTSVSRVKLFNKWFGYVFVWKGRRSLRQHPPAPSSSSCTIGAQGLDLQLHSLGWRLKSRSLAQAAQSYLGFLLTMPLSLRLHRLGSAERTDA